MKTKIMQFLQNNGFTENSESDSDYVSYNKEGCYGVDVGNDEVVLIDDSGDFAHIPMNHYTLYALFGMLFHYHQLDVNYKWS